MAGSEPPPSPPARASAEIPIGGSCDPRFAAVRDAFRANFELENEVGAAVSLRLGDAHVVDLWGGHVDAARTRPWQRDTLVNTWSVGKGVAALLVLIAVERGALDLDAPVARVWPEFAAAGKSEITLRALLAHRAGLPAIRERLPDAALFEPARLCAALAAQAPYWEPDSCHGYHVNTYGFLLGEVLRRATGLRIEDALRDWVTGPLDADFHFGLPTAEHGRSASVIGVDVDLEPADWEKVFPATGDAEFDQMVWNAYGNPTGLSGVGIVNTPAWRSAVIPSANAQGTARAVSSIYAAMLGAGPAGMGWPSAALRAEAVRTQSHGVDYVLRRSLRYGLGFQLSEDGRPLGSPTGFGHYGYGGSIGFADPGPGLAFGFLSNRPGDRWRTTRTLRLMDAVYDCLGG